jgi:uncharacterized membrane protein YcaP (DUF421 family)
MQRDLGGDCSRRRDAAMWLPEIAVWEKAFRSLVVYLFLLVAFRVTGKRQVGQLTPFDLTVLLIISNVVQNAISGPDDSLTGGLIGAAVIFLANYLVAEITFRSRRVRRLLEAAPTLLVHNGRILHKNMTSERVTLDELHAALRRSGVSAVDQVRVAVLEESGGISVIARRVDGSSEPTVPH